MSYELGAGASLGLVAGEVAEPRQGAEASIGAGRSWHHGRRGHTSLRSPCTVPGRLCASAPRGQAQTGPGRSSSTREAAPSAICCEDTAQGSAAEYFVREHKTTANWRGDRGRR